VAGPRLGQAGLVFVIAAATFLPALHNGLLGDDAILLEQRLDSSRAPSLAALFRQSYWDDLHNSSGLYRPLSLAFLLAQRRVFGLNPLGYHVVSLLLHSICSILVLRLLWRLVPARAALAGAILFAVHPVHSEAVTTIYGQEDLWCALFFLAALSSAGWPSLPSRGALRLGGVALFYLLSLLCKEQGALLPALLVFRSQDRDRRPTDAATDRLEPRLFVLLCPVLVYAALRVNALGALVVPTGEASIAAGYPWWARANLVIVSIGTYLRLLVVPWGQTTYYALLREALFGTPALEIGVVLVTVASFLRLRQTLGPTVADRAAVVLAITLLPVANVLPIGMVVGERCLYLPSVGLCVLAAAAYAWLEARSARTAIAALCAVTVVGIALSVRVAWRWHTPMRHWETTIADHPRSAGAHARLALLLLTEVGQKPGGPDDPRITRAEDAVRRALEINPRNSDAWEGKGLLALLRRDCAGAAAAFQQMGSRRREGREFDRLLQPCAK